MSGHTYTTVAIGIFIGLLIGWLMDVWPRLRDRMDHKSIDGNKMTTEGLDTMISAHSMHTKTKQVRLALCIDNIKERELGLDDVDKLAADLGIPVGTPGDTAFKTYKPVRIAGKVYCLQEL